jgi:hypothetical protein
MHRTETLNLLNHLLHFQPTYVAIEKPVTEDTNTVAPSDGMAEAPKHGAKADAREGRWGALEEPSTADYEAVNLKVGDQALRLAAETRQVGQETLSRLKEQAEALDRIERNVLETRNNLDQGDRILDGVSSTAGQLKNMLTPNLHVNKFGAYEAKDRTVRGTSLRSPAPRCLLLHRLS